MGRLLCLDFGTRRIGAALSDHRRSIASPLEVYHRQSPPQDAAHYRKLIAENDVDSIVIGLPLHTSGEESDLSSFARSWGRWLADLAKLPVTYYDERYSSADAEDFLRTHGFRRKGVKARRDMLAAQMVLQRYLDAGCPTSETPGSPLEDPPAVASDS
jgi:putative pre-16S rRNA nuclease